MSFISHKKDSHISKPSTAEEEPDIKWFKGGAEIKKSKRVKINWNISDDTQFIEIKQSRVEDAGEYTVTVSSAGGKVSKTATVVVNAAAEDVTVEEDLIEMEDVAPACHAPPAPKPEVPPKKEEEEESSEEEGVEKAEILSFTSSVSVEEGETILIKFKLKEGRLSCVAEACGL